MAATRSRAVIVTGCSSGIGHATAAHLAAAGWPVYATARRPETLGALEAKGCRTLTLDVTDEDSMAAAVAAVEAEHGAVGVLVNNAGYSQSGAVESVPPDRLRAQFETNVFGLARMCQLVAPGMREQRWGKIVNLSSMGGRLTFPGGGVYHASKYAVESLSDAMRFELGGFRVDVIVIEPGITRTGFADAAVRAIDSGASGDGPYAAFNAQVAATTAGAYERGIMRLLSGTPDVVARRIEEAITAARPRARYRVTPSARLMLTIRAILPDRAWDAFLDTQFPRPGTR
jgi:NAD(P)-dependent dehydrogenase (short-subunit alcohol dehydrogenase family)